MTNTTSSYACPRCRAPLAPLQAGAYTLGACRACAGVFAPNAAAVHLAEKLDEEMAAAVTRVSAGSADLSALPDGSPELPCPVCGDAMSRVVVSETSIDTCILHGTWFDAWELERVMRAKDAENKPWGAVGTRETMKEMPPVQPAPAPQASRVASTAANVSEGVGMAAVEVVGDVAVSAAGDLAVEGIFAVIAAIFG